MNDFEMRFGGPPGQLSPADVAVLEDHQDGAEAAQAAAESAQAAAEAAEANVNQSVAELTYSLGNLYYLLPDENGDTSVILAFSPDGTIVSGFNSNDNPIPASGGADGVPVRSDPVALGYSFTLGANDRVGFTQSGQSLSYGGSNDEALTLTQPLANVMLDNGPLFTGTDGTSLVPLTEVHATPNGESSVSSAANYAVELSLRDGDISAASQMVVVGGVAGVGSTSITDWISTGTRHTRLIDMIDNMNALLVADGKTLRVPLISWMQGEADTAMATATYLAHLLDLQADWEDAVQTITGQTQPVPMLLYQTGKASRTSGTVQEAQFQACRDYPDRFWHSTTIVDFGTVDTLHIDAPAQIAVGHYQGRALKQAVKEAVRPQWLRPISALAHGTQVRVKFAVPYKPMFFGSHLSGLTDNGVAVEDDTGALTISNLQVVGGDTLIITVNRALAANPEVRFARDYVTAGCEHENAAQCNLRDSCPDAVTVDGTEYPLFHRVPHCTLAITAVS